MAFFLKVDIFKPLIPNADLLRIGFESGKRGWLWG